MPDPSLEEALKATLADYRLTRSEKRALAGVVKPIADDPQQMAYARSVAFKLIRSEFTSPDQLAMLEWLEDVVKVLQADTAPTNPAKPEAYFSPRDRCPERIVRLFDSARKSVDVCVFTITDNRITEAILEAHRRRVAIRVISDDDKSEDLGSDIELLSRRGIPVRVDRTPYHMHHKFAIFDSRRLLTGSYNWTRSAAENNEENFVVTGDSDLLVSFRRAFDDLWQSLK